MSAIHDVAINNCAVTDTKQDVLHKSI